MAWGKQRASVVDSKPAYRGTKKDGSRKQVGTKLKLSDGTTKVLLNPQGKATKYCGELKDRVHKTNDGKLKTTKNGETKRLTDTEAAYRGGYVQAMKDQAKAYNGALKKNGQCKNCGGVNRVGRK